MSLNYDLTKLDPIKKAEFFAPTYFDGDDTPYMSNKLESMIFWTMGTGIGHITEENYETAFYRYLRASRFTGRDPEKPYLTLAHFEAAIGLRTNVVNMTDDEWLGAQYYVEKARKEANNG